MPYFPQRTAVQQSLPQIVCMFCHGLIYGDIIDGALNSSPYREVCVSCYDNRLMRCTTCSFEAFDADFLTRTHQHLIYERRLGIQYSNYYIANDTQNRVCADCVQICDECDACFEWDDNAYNCCRGSYDGRTLLSYSYRPSTWYYYDWVNDSISSATRPTIGSLYMGIELEIMKMSHLVDDFHENADTSSLEYLYFKEDGSLGDGGAELVTMPGTLEAHREMFPFDALDLARSDGARSYAYSCCGFHIHVARSAFTPTHMWKFIKFQMNNPGLCQIVAQRDESSYATWYYDEHEKNDLPDYIKGKKSNGRRYLAINFQNYATVELRYFKGNILKAAILKNLEFVQSIYDYTKSLTVRQVTFQNGLSEDSYKDWLFDEQVRINYPNLFNFLSSTYYQNDTTRED